MGIALNKNTMQIRESIPTSVYESNPDWLIIKSKDIDMKLPDCDKKYWKVKGNKVVEMDVIAKKAVDDAEQAEKEKLAKEANRERIIQETIHKMGEDKAVADGLIEPEEK